MTREELIASMTAEQVAELEAVEAQLVARVS
jgi:hypothetical protein